MYNHYKYHGKSKYAWIEHPPASHLTIQLLLLSSITSIIYGLFDYWTSAYLFWWRVSTVTFILSAITFYFDVKRKLRRGETRCVPFRDTLYCKYMTILFVESEIGILMMYMAIMTQYNFVYWFLNETIVWTIFSCLGICFQSFVMYDEYETACDKWVEYYEKYRF